MTLTIGRVTIARDPTDVEHDGDNLDLGGWFFGTTLAHAKVIRQQMLGLADNDDEPEVPVTWTGDSDIDGYYTIRSVNVTVVLGMSYSRFVFEYRVQLTRVRGGFALPVTEVAAALALRTNGVGVTIPGGVVGVPLTASFRAARFVDGQVANMLATASLTRQSATGDLILANFKAGSSPNFMSVTSAMQPTDYYDGAATIEQLVAGTWYPVVGDQIGYVVGSSLRVGNGLVRATFHTDGVITSEIFDGTVWESSTSFSLRNDATKTWVAEGGWKILRNDPAACTIRTSAWYDLTSGNYPGSVTLYVARGSMLFEVFVDNMFYIVDQQSDVGGTLDLRANTVTAATALTGGIRQTSNNAQGHRWVLMSASAVINDLVNGRITINGSGGVPLIAQFGIGWEIDGSASGGVDTAAWIAEQYFAVSGTRQRVVSK